MYNKCLPFFLKSTLFQGQKQTFTKLSWKAAPNYSVLEIKLSTSPSVPCANKNIHIVTIMDPAIRK